MSHPDSGVLAEFRAGLIGGRRGARISAHLATCEYCAGLCDKLAEVSVLLAAAPAPVMPDRVARRLDGVLAAEAAQRDDSERAGGHTLPGRLAGSRPTQSRPTQSRPAQSRPTGSRPTGTGPGRHRNFRLVALRVLAPGAALLLLAAGGYGLSQIGGASSTVSSAAAKPALPSATSANHTGMVPERQPLRHSSGQASAASLSFVISATDYRRAALRQQLEQELQLQAQGAVGQPKPAPSSVRACVLRVTRGITPGTLLLVEKAHFQGQPVTVIVALSGHQRVAWVTGGACSAADENLLATTTLPGTSAA